MDFTDDHLNSVGIVAPSVNNFGDSFTGSCLAISILTQLEQNRIIPVKHDRKK
ncbi:hypothetical protein GCM10027442_22240 [Emticicia fontis]